MRALSTSQLLEVWEIGQVQPAYQRPLLLLTAACPDWSVDELARLSLGVRDSCLLTLREWAFGPDLVSVANCPACGERVELSFQVADIRTEPTPPLPDKSGAKIASLQVAGYEASFRLPNTLDLAAINGTGNLDQARTQLLARCLVSIQPAESSDDPDSGAAVKLNQLPETVLEAIVVQMAQVDPQADTQLALSCPTCSHTWQAAFDIATFFWSELEAWAQRLLGQVHTLAWAYGWSEADILSMSAVRRQAYLALLGGA